MQRSYYERCQTWFSSERLGSYARRLPADATDSDVLAYHLWNTALSQALYATTQAVEVTVRNQLHRAFSNGYGTEEWYRPGVVPDLDAWQADRVRQTLQDLRRRDQRRLHTGTPPSPAAGRVVAELNFGFWVGFFNDYYEPNRHSLWRVHRFTQVFPYLPRDEPGSVRNRRTYRTRRSLAAPLNRVLKLRNRISHHEPIWYWKDPPAINNLGEQHAEALELLYWIDPLLRDTARLNDQFLSIYGNGPSVFHSQIEEFVTRLERSMSRRRRQ